jgi:endoglucanase
VSRHRPRRAVRLGTVGLLTLVVSTGWFAAEPSSAQPDSGAAAAVATSTTTATTVRAAAVKAAAGTALAAPSGSLYVDPKTQVAGWLQQNAKDWRAATIKSRIGSTPTAHWFVNDSDAQWVDAYVDGAAARGKVPLLGAYNLPQRDCGSYSAGGAKSNASYLTWITKFAAGIGNRKAVVLLEPDSLYYIDCLNATALKSRQDLLRRSVDVLAAKAPNAVVYLDGGTPVHGTSGADMAARLAPAGIGKARGFFVNVANFRTDGDSEAFAVSVNRTLSTRYGVSGRHFVIDSSRNGNGSNGQWCNPAGRKVGRAPSWSTSTAGRDGYVWAKVPGESDGSCGIAPTSWSGQFVPDLAYKLATGS